MKLSVAIPTHQIERSGYFFKRCLDSLWNQTFQDFEIVVSDNSNNDVIEDICAFYGGIRYFRNPPKGMADNHNEAIRRSQGELIKLLQMDDFMVDEDSLQEIVGNFEDKDWWLITGCLHIKNNGDLYNYHESIWNDRIYTGDNTLGSISTLTIRNKSPMLFDESLSWVVDCDLYKRYYDKYGLPKMLKTANVVIDVGTHRLTRTLSDELKRKEMDLLTQRYDK